MAYERKAESLRRAQADSAALAGGDKAGHGWGDKGNHRARTWRAHQRAPTPQRINALQTRNLLNNGLSLQRACLTRYRSEAFAKAKAREASERRRKFSLDPVKEHARATVSSSSSSSSRQGQQQQHANAHWFPPTHLTSTLSMSCGVYLFSHSCGARHRFGGWRSRRMT